jgi:alkaline phosphatase D
MKIVFTSCVRFESFPSQPEWDFIFQQDPDYLFLLGDNIYMDWIKDNRKPARYSLEKFQSEMTSKYNNQWNEPHFKHLREYMRAKNGFFGVWDDHDFAWNGAKGAEMTSAISKAKKAFSRSQFHHYFENCSTNLPEVYYSIDTPVARVIFLDNRYYAEKQGDDSKLLGEKQFRFLAEKLEHNLKYTLICGGLSLTQGDENWGPYPKELLRLSQLLATKKNVLFLAGDIHKNAFIKPRKLIKGVSTPPQIISSGMHIKLFKEKHNWAMLDFSPTGLKVKFFQRNSTELPVSQNCNDWLMKHGY